jgi:hypothetical protein
MEGHTYYRIPNCAGGELTIQCNHTYSNNKTSLWMNDLTDPVIEGTETYTTEHIRFIDFDYYSDTYVYATISLTATKIWPDTPTWTYSGTIDLYRNTELFYSYELTNSTMNLRQSNQLPWLPECWVNTTQPGIQYIFEFLLDRELPWLDDAEWTSEDYVNTVYTRNYFFDTPTRLEEFTFNRGEMDTESSPPVRRAYRFPCRTVVNPGEDLSDADLITTICYQEMEEGNMETPQYVYKTWWNHTGPNSETLEEMLLISDKTNPRITNFGVI